MRNICHKLLTILAMVSAIFGPSLKVQAVDIPGSAKESGPLAVPGTGLKGEYWKRPRVSIPTDGAANEANRIDTLIQGFGPADGRFSATKFVYLGNDLSLVKDWLGSDGATFVGTTNNLDDGAFRFKGFVNITAPGTINVGTTSDDGSRIKIGGVDIINNDGSHGDATVNADVNFLEAGLYPVEITYWNGDWTSDGVDPNVNHSGNPDPSVHGGANFHLLVNGANISAEQVALLHPSAASPLPTLTQIGRNRIGTSTYDGGGSFTIVGGGNDIWDSFDEFTYANKEVTGDFDVKVRVESLEANAQWTKAGLMIRETVAEDSRNIFLRVTPPAVPVVNPAGANGANDTRLAYRTGRSVTGQSNDGAHEDIDAANTLPAPPYPNAWLRITRVGPVFTAYNSDNGTDWQLVASQDTATWQNGGFAGTALVGLGVSRHSGNNTAKAEFRNFSLTQGSAGDFNVIGASSRGNPTGVRVEFSQPVGAGALTAGNYSLNNGATVISVAAGADPATVQLTTSALVEGTAYTVTVNDSAVMSGAGTALNFDKATATFTHGAGFEARAIRVAHSRIGDSGVYQESLARSRDLPEPVLGFPAIETNTGFEDPLPDTGSNEQFSSKIAGVLNITTSGAYKFYCSSDDFGFLYLSADDDPANKVEIAREPAWNGSRQYIAGDNQATRGNPPANISAAINLEAGKKYYLEFIYTEGGGGNNGSATWLPPGGAAVANGSAPIPASAFMPARMKDGNVFTYLGNVTVVSQPANASKVEGQTATFSVRADGTPGYTYQWRRNGVNIPNSNRRDFTTPVLGPTDNNTTYDVVVANEFSSATSSVASLTVAFDMDPPTLVSARQSDLSFSNIVVTFSEPVAAASAQNAGNYSIPGLTIGTATLQAGNSTVLLTVSPAMTVGSTYTLTVKDVKDRSFSAYSIVPNPSTATIQAFVFTRGFLSFEVYNGLSTSDNNIRNTLLASPKFPSSPDARYALPVMDTRAVYPDNSHEGYGGRLSGYFIPPTSGNWIFYIGSDDSSILYLNPTGTDPAGKVNIIEETACCTGWAAHASPAQALTAGQSYYIEGIYKEGTGGDYMKVAARLEGAPAPEDDPNGQIPISVNAVTSGALGQYFDPSLAPALTITQQPVGVTNFENGRAIFTVAATRNPAGPIAYQWQKNGVDIAFANNPTLTLEPLSLADNDANITCIVSVPGRSITSASAKLGVVVDDQAPRILSVQPGSFFEKITINFDEKVNPMDAVDTFNYALGDGINTLTLANGVLSADGRSVIFQIDPTTPMLEDKQYTLTVSNVKDLVGNAITSIDRMFRSPVFSCGFLYFETFNGTPGPANAGQIGGTAISGMTSHPTYPNNPSETFFLPGFDTRQNALYATDVHENYGGRIRGLFVPPTSGNWIFYLRSDDASQLFFNPAGTDAAGATMLTEEPGCCGAFEAHASAPQALTAGQRYYIEALYKEGGGGDYCQVAARLDTDTSTLRPIPASQIGVYADPTGAAINITRQPADQTFLIIPPSGNASPVLDQDFTSSDGGFTVETPNAFSGTPWAYVAAAGSWQVNQADAENGAANTTLLSSPTLNVGRAGYVQVAFTHRWSVETPGDHWDGCAIEVSVNGGAFSKVPGSAFTTGGYNGTVRAGSRSILTGQEAFVEDSPNHQGPGYVNSVASLGYMNAGDTVVLRFVYAGDTNTKGTYTPSWEIDKVKVTDGNAPSTAMFTVEATASIPAYPNQSIFYSWQRDNGAGFAPVAGANGSVLTIAPTAADNGAQFRCVLYIPGAVRTTDVATLTVAQPNTPPQFVCGPSQQVLENSGAQAVPNWATGISPHSITRNPVTFASDFTSMPAGTRLLDPNGVGTLPDPRVEAGVLKLTDALDAGGFGGFAIGPFAQQTFESLQVSWKSRVGGGGGGGADGYSMNFGNDLVDNFQGEEGNGTGLSVAVDTFDNADIEVPDVGLEINWKGARVTALQVPKDDDGTGNYLRKDTFVNASLSVDASGLATFTYDGNVLTAQLTGYNGIAVNQINLGARTGGANDNQWIDDLNISAFPADASTAEANQVVSFVVTTDHPEYFSVQPAVSRDGTLTYTACQGVCGLAKVTIRAMDSGGTANGGSDTSAPCTIDINIVCVNTAPVALNWSADTALNTPVTIPLLASDADGDALSYIIVADPAHGTLSGSGVTRTYTPAPNYTGADSFTFKVNDGRVDSGVATVSINVRESQGNQFPVPRIVAEEVYDFQPNLSNLVVISCNGTNATLTLDGSQSFDADGDPLSYSWFLDSTPTPFSTNVTATTTLDLGESTIRLVAMDPKGGEGMDTLTVEVLTLVEAIDELKDKVNASNLTAGQKRLFLARLNRASYFAALGYDPDWRRHRKKDSCWRLHLAGNFLWAFERNVWAVLRNRDRDLARCLMDWADNIITAIDNCPCDDAQTAKRQ